jgi:hypothetical protein
MKKIFNLKILFFLCFAALAFTLILESCKHKSIDPVDSELLEKSKNLTGVVWYKNSDAFLDKSSGTGHNFRYLRTRYNAIAARKLEANGKIISGAKFDEGSLIVKELYKDKNSLNRYAALYKDSKNEYADAQGWVWAYIDADGKVAAPASERGKSCISCHTQSSNIDYMLMNKFFP